MELEGLLLEAEAAVSHQSLIQRNCDGHQVHAFAHKFKDLIMMADVASSITTTAATLLNQDKKKKTEKKQDRLTPKSSLSNFWSLQVHENSNLKLRLGKISKTTLVSSRSTQTSSNPSLSSHPIDQESFKFSNLNLLADVAASSSSSSLLDDWDYNRTTYPTKKKQKRPRSVSAHATWSLLQVSSCSDNLKLCFKKSIKSQLVSSTSNSNPSQPIDLLAQVAFAYETSSLWALCANTVPTRKRSTSKRRPKGEGFNFKPSKAGTKRGFGEFNASHDQQANESHALDSSNKRRRVTPSLPVQLSNFLATKKAASEPKLVIIKQLFESDLNPNQCRFSIPVNQVIDLDFLTSEDKRRLDDREAIDVTLIQPCLEETPMQLKKWMMNQTAIYVLNKGWKSVIENKKNPLHINSTVELWSFTCNGALYFALSASDGIRSSTLSAGSRRKGNSKEMEPSSDDESTITFQKG